MDKRLFFFESFLFEIGFPAYSLRLLQTFAGLHLPIFFFFCQENESSSVKVSFPEKM